MPRYEIVVCDLEPVLAFVNSLLKKLSSDTQLTAADSTKALRLCDMMAHMADELAPKTVKQVSVAL